MYRIHLNYFNALITILSFQCREYILRMWFDCVFHFSCTVNYYVWFPSRKRNLLFYLCRTLRTFFFWYDVDIRCIFHVFFGLVFTKICVRFTAVSRWFGVKNLFFFCRRTENFLRNRNSGTIQLNKYSVQKERDQQHTTRMITGFKLKHATTIKIACYFDWWIDDVFPEFLLYWCMWCDTLRVYNS